ncbi:MAG: hypothetical protein JXA46_12470 [Dehalococcoidales bacterium]|nr:hypothetical protein [Dehalococcoidales bacterium]
MTDLKILGHSEGGATVGTYISDWADQTGNISQSANNLLNSQLSGVFLVDCPTGKLPNSRIANYNYRKLNGLGEKLSYKGIVSADIFNSCSLVHQSTLSGWDSRDVAGWGDKVSTWGSRVINLASGDMLKFVTGLGITTNYYHGRAMTDALTVIKDKLQK